MSCEVSIIASIEQISKIRKILFSPDTQNDTDSWLQLCKISVSPTGDLIVIGSERTIVILTPKWDFQSSSNTFQISYNGLIHDYDKVKAILCITVKDDSDWTCILIGFDSGFVRCYTDTCDLIFEEQFHAENIVNITYKKLKSSKQVDEVYIQYQSVLCTVNGQQLISAVRNRQDTSLVPKKWGFQDQSNISDSAIVGLNVSNTFDHLLTASTCGGFYTKYRAMPPNSTLVLAAGMKPFLGYHYALEGGGQPVLSDVAKAVASKLKSTLPTWLMGNRSMQEKPPPFSSQPAEPMGCRFGLSDLRRTATDIVLSPDHKLAAVSDTLGRILLIDAFKGVVLKMFKGYREGQCSFIRVKNETKSKNKFGNKFAHFLIIYSPKKGTIEVFSVQQGSRIAIFSASKHSRLLYGDFWLSPSKNNQCSTLFIDNNGLIKEIMIPFHFTLSEKNNKKARDLHLYKKIRHILKSDFSEKNDSLILCKEIKTNDVKIQLLEFLIGNKNLQADFILNCIQVFLENPENNEILINLCNNVTVLLNLYIFSLDTHLDDKEDTVADVEISEMLNLKKLLNLSTQVETPADLRVKFTDNLSFSPSEFLSIFSHDNYLKTNIDENILFKSSEYLFKNFINGTSTNFSDLQYSLIQSKIPTKNLLTLLLNYWVNRPLNITLNLEKDMKKLLILLNIIVKIEVIDDVEYEEVSKFWSDVRNILMDSARPFPALMAALLCKKVCDGDRKKSLDESATSLSDMEVLTQEDVEWSLVIGKLEDISLLNIILSTKPTVKNCPLPKLKHEKTNISLKYILQKGKGSISELIAQWLTTVGFDPQNIIINESLKKSKHDSEDLKNPIQEDVKFYDNFKLLRDQFPYSSEANCLVTNMAWEYATAWQKEMQDLDLLNASIRCLDHVQNQQIKQGLFQLLWNAHLKIVTENSSKLINKVGKLPKERLCKQDTGLTDYQLTMFLTITTNFLDSFMETAKSSQITPKEPINFENIWDNGGKPLVELAMQQRDVNFELLFLHYQLSLVMIMTVTFPTKHSKPINNLFDVSIVNLFFTDLQKKIQISSNKSDIRLNSNRLNFLFKIILASMETITKTPSGELYSTDHVIWMSKCMSLGKIWNLDIDGLRRYQIVKLFERGFDSLAEELIPMVNESQELGKCLLRVAGKRLSLFLVSSPQLSDNISAFSTGLTKYMQSLNDDWCASSPLKEITTLATHVVHCLTETDCEYKLAVTLLEACKDLEQIQS